MKPSRQQPKKNNPTIKPKKSPPFLMRPAIPAGSEPTNAWPQLDIQGQQRLLRQLQKSHGNQFVQRFLENGGVDIAIQRAVGAPSGPTKAAQETKARNSTTSIRTIITGMLTSPNPRVANTARLIRFTGSKFARLDFKAMTVRSDNVALKAKVSPDAANDNFYFYGQKQDNKHQQDKDTAGTIEGGSTLLIRTIDNSNNPFTNAFIISFIVHEVSHLLSKSYEDFPKSTQDAGSRDRYKDEFRGYWVETARSWSLLSGVTKAHAIRDHLVGTSKTGPAGYPDLKAKYWNTSDTSFKVFVDNYISPEGYNLGHNPNLDRLAVLIQSVKKRKSTFKDVLAHISKRMSPSERTEAFSNSYFTAGNQAWKALGTKRYRRVKLSLLSYKFHAVADIIDDIKTGKKKYEYLQRFIVRYMTPKERADVAGNDYFQKGGEADKILGSVNHKRMMNSLALLKREDFAEGLNPDNNEKVTWFLSAISNESENAIKINYKGLSKKEKGRISFNGKPYVMVFVDRHISDIAMRASIDAMISGGGEKQYNAVRAFLVACEAAKKVKAKALTADIRATFKKLRYTSRWGLFLNEKVRARYIDSLPKALSSPIVRALRR